MAWDRAGRERVRAAAALVLATLAAVASARPRLALLTSEDAPEADELQAHLTGWAAALAPLHARLSPDVVLGFACPTDDQGVPDPDLDFKFGLIQAALAPRRIARGAREGPVVAHERALEALCRSRGWPAVRVRARLSPSWAVVERDGP